MFYDSRLPENISINFEKTVNFNTEINRTKNSKEQRIKLSDICYNMYNIKYENLTKSKINSIISFFNIMYGRYYSFRFKDWTDYNVSNQIIGTYYDNNQFQLVKTYSINSLDGSQIFYTKDITKPINNTVKIYVNDIQINNFTVDDGTGIVTINSILNKDDIITADFEFDVHVRFFDDELKIVNKTKNISEINSLKLIEVF